ncbi:MAG: hypothetical protein ACLUE1_04600 [Adlercreutzia equolifaciens]
MPAGTSCATRALTGTSAASSWQGRDRSFYAIPLYPGICNTIGGARRNENANIVDPSGNPIPRLYSAGSFGNMNGHTYAITGGNGSGELVRWPYRRPQCRRPRTLGCRDRGLDPAWRR